MSEFCGVVNEEAVIFSGREMKVLRELIKHSCVSFTWDGELLSYTKLGKVAERVFLQKLGMV